VIGHVDLLTVVRTAPEVSLHQRMGISLVSVRT
jgi:hypothetical protein